MSDKAKSNGIVLVLEIEKMSINIYGHVGMVYCFAEIKEYLISINGMD